MLAFHLARPACCSLPAGHHLAALCVLLAHLSAAPAPHHAAWLRAERQGWLPRDLPAGGEPLASTQLRCVDGCRTSAPWLLLLLSWPASEDPVCSPSSLHFCPWPHAPLCPGSTCPHQPCLAACSLPLQNCAVCPGNRVCQQCDPGYQFLSPTNRSQCVPLCFVPNCAR